MKLYAINIKFINKTFNLGTYDYIITVCGNKLEVDGSTWWLWVDKWLVTTGNIRDLHAVRNRHYTNMDMEWDDIVLDYTPVSYN